MSQRSCVQTLTPRSRDREGTLLQTRRLSFTETLGARRVSDSELLGILEYLRLYRMTAKRTQTEI